MFVDAANNANSNMPYRLQSFDFRNPSYTINYHITDDIRFRPIFFRLSELDGWTQVFTQLEHKIT